MKNAKKLIVALLSLVSCACIMVGALSSVSAANESDVYYDWDGKELSWSFDANGISEQIPFKNGGNNQFFTVGDWPALGSDSDKINWLNKRYNNAANTFYGIVDPINDYRAEADGSYIVMKTPHEGGVFESDNRYNARTMYIDLTDGITYDKPINIRFTVDPDDEWANTTGGQDRYVFFSLYDDLSDLMDYSHPHNFWFVDETAMTSHPSKLVVGFGTEGVANEAAKNKFFSTKNVSIAQNNTYEFIQTEHVLTLYIGSKLFDGTGGDYSYIAIDGVEVGGLNITKNDFASERVYIALGSQGRGTQLKLNLSQSESSWNTITYSSATSGFSKENTHLRPSAYFTTPDAPTITGHTFDGWYIDEACTVRYQPERIYSSFTLYAKYLNNSKTYDTVTIKAKTGGFNDVTLKLEHNKNFPVIGNVFYSDRFTPVFTTENGTAVTTSTMVTGNMTIYAEFVEDKFDIYFRVDNGEPLLSTKYDYNKDHYGWDTAVTRYKGEDYASNTYYVTADNKVVINQYYGSPYLYSLDPENGIMTLATVAGITNLNRIDLTREFNFRYQVNNDDISKGATSGKIIFRLFDNVYDSVTAGHKNNSNAKVAIQTNTVSGQLYYGAFYSIFDKVASGSCGYSSTQWYDLTFYIGENAGDSYFKVNGTKVDGALASVTRNDFEGGYAYFQIGNEGSSHRFVSLLSQKSKFTKGAAVNGTYTVDVADGDVEFNKPINLTFTPNQGYGVYSVKVVAADGTERDVTNDLTSDNKLTINKGWGDETVVVEFASAHTVTFNTNGGSAIASQAVLHGAFPLRPKQPTKTGYQFKGYFTTADFSGPEYKFGSLASDQPVTSDMTLYVKWVKKGSTVNPGGGGTSGGGTSGGGNGSSGSGTGNSSAGVGCMSAIGLGALLPSVIAIAVAGSAVVIKRKRK